MNGHFVNVCQFGEIHGQCRCINRDKDRRVIECPTPHSCKPRPRPRPGRVPLGNPRCQP